MTNTPMKKDRSEEQPVQLALFKLTGPSYTNAFEFYESIPRFIASGDRNRETGGKYDSFTSDKT